MPSCRPDVIPEIIYKIMEMKPKTVLDVGAGHGKWGCLIAEYCKYWLNYLPVIDAIEFFESYKSPAYGFYRTVWQGSNVMDLLGLMDRYDLVLIIDVIEHLDRWEGKKLLASIKNHYIVSTPGYWSPQTAMFGNERERHVSRWALEDFENSRTVVAQDGRSHILGWK